MRQDLMRYFGRASGSVQGVGFRYFVQKNAMDMNVTGWVRNMEDSTVTMELQGTEADINVLTKRIRAGSFFIKVRELVLKKIEVIADDEGFSIRN
ncbi:MAG: acylphosphatase [Selenomonadaceae bacterium]